MSHKDDAVYVEHRLSCIRRVEEYIGSDKEVLPIYACSGCSITQSANHG